MLLSIYCCFSVLFCAKQTDWNSAFNVKTYSTELSVKKDFLKNIVNTRERL